MALSSAGESRKRYPHVTLILLASHDMPEYRKAGVCQWGDYFISKEFPLGDCFALIEEALSA